MRGFALAAALWLVGAGAALADAPDCEALAEAAGARHGIPQGTMAAIARTESGGGPRRSAWPWTLNMGGDGRYLPSRAEALTLLRAVLAEGQRNVDVGCMQINWHWHNDAFDSLEQMIDPDANTDYAARFLVSLWRREGTWDAAVQAYHSTDPERGTAYLARVERNRGATSAAVAQADGGLLSEGVLRADADPPVIAAPRRDGRFTTQAPLVAVSERGGGALPQDPSETAILSSLPAGALPDMAAVRPGRPGDSARAAGPALLSDRMLRLRADFSQLRMP